jgi:hypothetical protein
MTEASLQSSCVKWYDLQYATERLRLFSIPNEGQRNPVNGARMKAMGRRKGAPDLVFMTDNGQVAFIEFKTEKGRQSPEQKAFQEQAERQHIEYHVVRTFDEFRDLIVLLRGETKLRNWQK